MQIAKLDHVNIVTAQLTQMQKWYEDFLGLRTGPRPSAPVHGLWLYAGDTAFVHLVEDNATDRVGSEVELKLEHFAFTAQGRREFEARLHDTDTPYERFDLESIETIQFHVKDPDGNHVHIDFSSKE